jgi:type IV pilus assembly protein PilA
VLVVVLIIGILAAIAIPAFLSQTSKAHDVTGKAQVRTAESAAETYATDNNGEYTGISVTVLQGIEPTLKETVPAKLIVAESTSSRQYKVESEDPYTKSKFSLERTAEGSVVRKCSPENAGGCPSGGEW